MENITPGQVSELIALFAKKLPLVMTKVVAQEWIDNPNRFESAITRTLIPTATEINPTMELANFNAEDTNLDEAIELCQKFTKEILGTDVDLRAMFNIPTNIPWKNVMLVFDPGLDNREAVEKAIVHQGIGKYEVGDVMEYLGSAGLDKPTLHLIENSITPTADTLGDQAKSPDQLNVDGRSYLDLRNYVLAFGQRYFGFKDYLDETTWTWFPNNRLSGGEVAGGLWDPRCRKVWFRWCGFGYVRPDYGARLAIPVSLKS